MGIFVKIKEKLEKYIKITLKLQALLMENIFKKLEKVIMNLDC